mgnify:CR=1 FL=1
MNKAISILNKYFGYDSFRRGQEEIINTVNDRQKYKYKEQNQVWTNEI